MNITSVRLMSALALVLGCASAQAVPRGSGLQCRVRGTVVSYDRSRATSPERGWVMDVAATDGRVLVVRAEDGYLVMHDLATGRVLARRTGTGRILAVSRAEVLLYRRAEGTHRAVRVQFEATGETVSPPLPLPVWALRSTDSEPAESVTGWTEGDATVMHWTAVTYYRGGVAPTPEMQAASHHEDCGSLRVSGAGAVLEGGALVVDVPTPPRSPVGPRPYVQQQYAGEGRWWLNVINAQSGVAQHRIVRSYGREVSVTLPPAGEGRLGDVMQVWAVGDRMVVLRRERSMETRQYEHPRTVFVLDAATGAVVWQTAIAHDFVVPPRP